MDLRPDVSPVRREGDGAAEELRERVEKRREPERGLCSAVVQSRRSLPVEHCADEDSISTATVEGVDGSKKDEV